MTRLRDIQGLASCAKPGLLIPVYLAGKLTDGEVSQLNGLGAGVYHCQGGFAHIVTIEDFRRIEAGTARNSASLRTY